MKKFVTILASMSISSAVLANPDVQLSHVPVGSTLSPKDDVVIEPNTTRTALSQSPNCYM